MTGTVPPARPDPNTYWLIEGRLLAGEYPGARDPAQARAKVTAFLKAGITTFIDLTEAFELDPYEPLLPQADTEHHRFPIRDLSVPRDARHMHAILDAIDTALWASSNGGRCGASDFHPATRLACETCRWQGCECPVEDSSRRSIGYHRRAVTDDLLQSAFPQSTAASAQDTPWCSSAMRLRKHRRLDIHTAGCFSSPLQADRALRLGGERSFPWPEPGRLRHTPF